jgi:hypothetical protein
MLVGLHKFVKKYARARRARACTMQQQEKIKSYARAALAPHARPANGHHASCRFIQL